MKKAFLFLILFIAVASVYGQRGVRRTGVRKASAVYGQRTVRRKGTLKSSKKRSGDITVTANGVSFKMIKVKGGTFTMGGTAEQGSDIYSDEIPTHRVTLSDYYIGQTEVTQALWKAVMGKNPSEFKGKNRPVENVSWNDCQTFIRKLNKLTGRHFRLLTEAEWEYAARGGNCSRGYKYSGGNSLGTVAWYADNSDDTTHEVKTKQPNELGIYDMSGNVVEWCNDWFSEDYYTESQVSNPKGPSSGPYHLARGGGWGFEARSCRVVYRDGDKDDLRCSGFGLRLAL